MTALPFDEALKTAEQWQTTMLECDAQMDSLCSLVGAGPEAPLPDAIYKMQGDYTRVVSDLLGISDEWLMAWWLEYNHGDRPMKAGLKGGPLREIKTLADLLALVRDDGEQP